MEDALDCGWTVYRITEFPDHFAVCRWLLMEDGRLEFNQVACLCQSLEEAREQVPQGTICFLRDSEDDPSVIETWI